MSYLHTVKLECNVRLRSKKLNYSYRKDKAVIFTLIRNHVANISIFVIVSLRPSYNVYSEVNYQHLTILLFVVVNNRAFSITKFRLSPRSSCFYSQVRNLCINIAYTKRRVTFKMLLGT